MTVFLLLALPAFFFLAHAARLVDFQVNQPPVLPVHAQQCTIKILERDFASSYGHPEIVQYTPPTNCGTPGSWAAITLNLTVTTNGTQYDRLATFTMQEVEVWRTSTPEPTYGDGIIWTYIKDITRYTPLFAEPGTFIFELDNIVQGSLTGIYHSVVYATFYASSAEYPAASHADIIIPIGSLANNTGAQASVPPELSVSVTVPQNAVEIYAEIYASGNAEEEFWYFNTANDYLGDLPSGTTYGDGPFREVRLLVDGQVAGVAFPYGVIFTGGYVPPAWRPITSYGALDLPTYYVDLTPFVPVLTSGSSHNISLDVASAESNHSINANWFVSANLQVVTDPSNKPTTGGITVYSVEPFAQTVTTGSAGGGELNVSVTATRKVHIEADIISGSGHRTHAIWSQDLTFSNSQSYLDNTLVQNVIQTASGLSTSTHNGVVKSLDQFYYPLGINFTSFNVNFTSWATYIDHSYSRKFAPSPFVLGSTIYNKQDAGGIFEVIATGNRGNGTSDNNFSYEDYAGNTYWRSVGAAFNNITYNYEGGNLVHHGIYEESIDAIKNAVQSPLGVRLPGGRHGGLLGF